VTSILLSDNHFSGERDYIKQTLRPY